MIKVVHVITRLDLGGAQQNTLYTCAHLNRAKFDVLLITGPGGILDAVLNENSTQRHCIIDSLVREISPGRDFLALLQLIRIFLNERPDIVHTHSSKAGILGRIAAWIAGVPVIIHTYHGFGFHDHQRPLIKTLYIGIERLCASLARINIFVSRENMAAAQQYKLGDSAQYVLIRSGIKLSDFPVQRIDKAVKKAALGIGVHKPLVISLGNLKPQKNPLDFAALAARVSATLPDTRWLFIGEGPLRTQVEARVLVLGLEGKFILPGWRQDSAQLLSCADVFVMTSLWEGLPRALLEAMKTGLPCVCYATDGVKDVITDGINGYLVAPGDLDTMTSRVKMLLVDDVLRQRLGRAAAQSMTREFDIDQMVSTQEFLYERLLTQ